MPVPAEVTTPIAPLEAPLGTIAVICDPESTVNDAATPLNETLLAAVNAEPVNVTFVPTGPEAGENELTVGATAVVVTHAGGVLVYFTSVVPPG